MPTTWESPKAKGNKKGKSLFEKIVAWVHLWPSIVSGIVLVFVCLTGTIVVYGDEIMDFSAGDAKYVTPQQNRITEAQISKNLEKAYPGLKSSEFVFFKDPARSIRIRAFNPKEGKLSMVYMDPYTGKILKKDDTVYFFFVTAHLHAELLAGEAGHWIVCISTIIFVISCLTGLILWWPDKWNRATRLASFTIKWKAKFKRVNYDLHNVFGFYSLILSLVLSVTGLLIAFPALMNAALSTAGIETETELQKELPKADSARIAKDLVPFAYSVLANESNRESVSIWSYNLSKMGAYVFTTGTVGLKSIENANITVYDKYTGEILNINSRLITHEKAENTVWQLHMGQWWGWFGKLSTFLAGIVATSLPITGFLIWWGKKKKKRVPQDGNAKVASANL